MNPVILAVHELYIRAYYEISDFEPVIDLESEKRFSEMLRRLLDAHKDVVTQLGIKMNEKILNAKKIMNANFVLLFL